VDVFVARQPIFDRQRRLYGYELLYRSDPSRNQFDGTEAGSATAQVISSALLSIGLQSILGGKKAFVNFNQLLLSDGTYRSLPPEATVLEILETVEPTPGLLALCRRIHQEGYTIALDDFVFSPQFEPLTRLAQFIKVDLRITGKPEQERLLATYRPRGIAMLAEKVETYEEFEWARAAGYDYFQGYFFARPSLIRSPALPASKLNCLRLLCEMQHPDLDYTNLESLIRVDVALTYKLLRYVNSALLGRRDEIRSIRQALVIVGNDNIRHWVALATLPMLAIDKPGELATTSIVRARFCELLAQLAGIPCQNEAFLMGMFSVLDGMLDRPLDQALLSMSLGPEITQALLGTAADPNLLSKIYRLTRRYELGDWVEVEELARACGFSASAAVDAYLGATLWAAQMLRLHLD
jgi:c-di-GMP-related signal transduction protein